MFVGKVLLTPPRALEFNKELSYLYARRDAIDKLMRSLRAYERYRPKPVRLAVRPRRSECA